MIDRAASALAVTLQSTFIISVVCMTTLPPANNSRLDPTGKGTALAKYTSSFVSVSEVSLLKTTLTVTSLV